MTEPTTLDRFVTAQANSYPRIVAELRHGEKTSHWMWFVFPQIAGLGRSATAQQYAIADLAEAEAYLAHPLLGPRLIDCAGIVVEWAGRRSVERIFGALDALKLRSCATLFERAGGDALFATLLDTHFGGVRDDATTALLEGR